MILSKGTTSYRKSELKILSARKALVSFPGIAIFRFGMSDAVAGSRETTIGP